MTRHGLIRRFVPAIAIMAAMAWPLPSHAEDSAVVFLVRHAEKADYGDDPELSPVGRKRAAKLAALLHDAGISHIYSTDFTRTRETAKPLSQKTGLTIELYDWTRIEDLLPALRRPGERSLVVGHSNTTPALVAMLGGPDQPAIDKSGEYDRLYVVTIDSRERVTAVLLRFGQPYLQ